MTDSALVQTLGPRPTKAHGVPGPDRAKGSIGTLGLEVGGETPLESPAETAAPRRPRLGFLGVGWIGRQRLEAIVQGGVAEIVGVADPARELAVQACRLAPGAETLESLEALLERDLDGIVIATPSALHAEQAIAALNRGVAVYCQKPLGRNAAETRAVIDAARKAGRLLGVDLCYRWVRAVRAAFDVARSGEIGDLYTAELTFHNAYGPDKAWFYDPKLSGGGCVIDLGIHLVDLALWFLGFPKVAGATSRLFAQGKPLKSRDVVEEYATARLDLQGGASVALSCSWKLPAGCDAIIEGRFYGSRGGVGFRNVNGSFYEFVGERFRGTTREVLAEPPDAWGGRAASEWVKRLAISPRFDPEIEHLTEVAGALDAIYESHLTP